MWSALTQLSTTLPELLALLREQNALLRELIQFHTRRPAQTPYTQYSQRVPLTRRLLRAYTERDVFVQTPQMIAEQQEKQRIAREHPYRTPQETLAEIEELQMQAQQHPPPQTP